MGNNALQKLRAWAFKQRGGIWTVLFVVILALARPLPARIVPGLILVALGQLLRFWGVGCITLYRGEEVKAQRLATWGPYALVRNPLYVANGLLGLGWAWMSGNVPTVVFLAAFCVLYGALIVPHEEAFLARKFGREYEDYKKRVGRFVPKNFSREALAHVGSGGYDASVLLKSEIHSLLVTVVGTALIFSRLWW
ncbi:isoprenylcysteine carboxylmethyltransferase family protein [Pyramidobacter sp. SM-530-WT-4B]|uniref:Isoprenylcysteine carboxylmethyltransferase family protein n=1 Tax=Pyramidobacter porci TaxID=2605789 RepID=A0A6L5Y9T4_9BACT|nr:isoprenylcysteine carboxylmethyltransferase family protein [Pyramidobacter porci]MST54768.1 isoprenylcysteine carboxylmethyltransferase family protein [Pyramidobacter porci]